MVAGIYIYKDRWGKGDFSELKIEINKSKIKIDEEN